MLATYDNEIPDWALPYVGIGLALVAGVLLALAVRAAFRASKPAKKRWGGAIGYLGLAACFAALGGSMCLGWDMMDGPLFVFLGGFACTGVGGSLAGWTRRGSPSVL
jgi:hypothetical protein